MTTAALYIVEFSGLDEEGETVICRFASGGYVSYPGDTPANTHYKGRKIDPGTFGQHMAAGARTRGDGSIEPITLALGNLDQEMDYLLDLSVDGRPITLLRLAARDMPLSSAVIVAKGTIERIDATAGGNDTDAAIRMRYYDRRRDLDQPIQTERYGGTTNSAGATADGSEDIEGQIKPLGFGVRRHVDPVLSNAYGPLILDVSDNACSSITLYDGGLELVDDGDEPSLADLAEPDINPGRYRTQLNGGRLRPGGAFRGKAGLLWTADVIEGATAADRYAGAVVTRMLAHMGVSGSDNVLASSFAALDAAAPYEVGIQFAGAETSAMTGIRQVLESVGAYMSVDSLGRFFVGRLTAPGTPVAVITDRDGVGQTFGVEVNTDTDGGLPTYRLVLKWGRHYKTHANAEIAGAIGESDPAQAGALQKEWREVIVEDLSIRDRHALAPVMEVETLLANKADAEAEAARQFALYSVERFVCEVTVRRELAATLPLGATATIAIPRLGFGPGRDMVVIGRSEELAAETVTLTMWG